MSWRQGVAGVVLPAPSKTTLVLKGPNSMLSIVRGVVVRGVVAGSYCLPCVWKPAGECFAGLSLSSPMFFRRVGPIQPRCVSYIPPPSPPAGLSPSVSTKFCFSGVGLPIDKRQGIRALSQTKFDAEIPSKCL